MALVDPGDQGSIAASSHVRGQNATEQAHRRRRLAADQRMRQLDDLRQRLERRINDRDDLGLELNGLYAQRKKDDEEVQRLKERKLVYKLFKQLDIQGVGTLSQDNIQRCRDFTTIDLKRFEDLLCSSVPTTYHVAVTSADFSTQDVQEAVASRIDVLPEAIGVGRQVTYSGEAIADVRLQWHMCHSDIPSDADDETQQRVFAEYFGRMGGSQEGCTREQGRAKEQQMRDEIEGALGTLDLGCGSISEDRRATFEDFYDLYWTQTEDNEMPEYFRREFELRRQEEEDTVLPEEAGDKITELEQHIADQRRWSEQKKKDTLAVEQDTKALDRKIEKDHRELAHVKRVTGYDREKSKPLPVDIDVQQVQVTELAALLTRLQEEKAKGAQILRKKTQLIEELSRELEDKKNCEEELFQLVNDLKVADRDLAHLADELDSLKVEHKKSDSAIVSLEGARDVGAMESLQMDRDYLKQQIVKHVDKKREQKNVVDCQGWRLNQLKDRLTSVEQAMRDLKLLERVQSRIGGAAMVTPTALDDGRDPYNLEQIAPQSESVDVELYELLNRDLALTTDSLKLKAIILDEKEATVEATLEKLQQLEMSNEEDTRYWEDEIWRDRGETEQMARAMEEQRDQSRRDQAALRQKVDQDGVAGAGARGAAAQLRRMRKDGPQA